MVRRLRWTPISYEIDWFGPRAIEVIANDGAFPRIGVGLLNGRELTINYSTQIVTLQ